MSCISRTYNIKSGSSLAAGTHEGCVVKLTDAGEVDLAADSGYPLGIVSFIDDDADTCTVVLHGLTYGKAGAAVTVGTSVPHLKSAADSRLDPASAGDLVVATIVGEADAADGDLIEVFVNRFELET